MGLSQTCSRVASLSQRHPGGRVWVPYLMPELFPGSACAKYPYDYFLQVLETWTSSFFRSPLEVGRWEALASLAWHSDQLQSAGCGGDRATHVSHVGQALSCNACVSQGELGKWTWCFKAGINRISGLARGWDWRKQAGLCLALNGFFVSSKEGWKHKRSGKWGFVWKIWQCYLLLFWCVGLLLRTLLAKTQRRVFLWLLPWKNTVPSSSGAC